MWGYTPHYRTQPLGRQPPVRVSIASKHGQYLILRIRIIELGPTTNYHAQCYPHPILLPTTTTTPIRTNNNYGQHHYADHHYHDYNTNTTTATTTITITTTTTVRSRFGSSNNHFIGEMPPWCEAGELPFAGPCFCKMLVPRSFVGMIIGQHGSTIAAIQLAANCRIRISAGNIFSRGPKIAYY